MPEANSTHEAPDRRPAYVRQLAASERALRAERDAQEEGLNDLVLYLNSRKFAWPHNQVNVNDVLLRLDEAKHDRQRLSPPLRRTDLPRAALQRLGARCRGARERTRARHFWRKAASRVSQTWHRLHARACLAERRSTLRAKAQESQERARVVSDLQLNHNHGRCIGATEPRRSGRAARRICVRVPVSGHAVHRPGWTDSRHHYGVQARTRRTWRSHNRAVDLPRRRELRVLLRTNHASRGHVRRCLLLHAQRRKVLPVRIHTDKLTRADFSAAVGMAKLRGVWIGDCSEHGSRKRARGFEVRLAAEERPGRRRRNSGQYGAEAEAAATYDEHGAWMNALYLIDPDAIVGPYANAQDFHAKTGNHYRTEVA